MTITHRFNFFRAGGFSQVRLATGADLMNLHQLDQKLWVALACPTQGLVFDKRTLELIDNDGDGRIRASELIGAIKWAASLLKDPDVLVQAPSPLPLSVIDDSSEAGKALLHAAELLLQGEGRADADSIDVTDAAVALQAFHAMPFNGDGVITEASCENPDQKQVLADIVASLGGVPDSSGKTGVDGTMVADFITEVRAWLAWYDGGAGDAALLPLKEQTSAALEALKAVRTKVDDYFARVRLAAFDTRAIEALNREEQAYIELGARDLQLDDAEIAALPLAQVGRAATLPLHEGLNPAWQAHMDAFVARLVQPLLGNVEQLDEATWLDLKARLAPYEQWESGKAGARVEALGLERLRALAAQDIEALLAPLLAREAAEAGTAEAMASVERLARYVRDLYRLTRNFVNFEHFYRHEEQAIFQVGTLYLDQRSTELCMSVDDAGRHATMAPLSRVYLVYCDCTRKGSGETKTIAAAFTNGSADNLMVGRNGVFYDREGRDWDATVTKLVENPISLREAFWSPYKKVLRFIEEQVAKRAAASEAAADERLLGTADKVSQAGTGTAEAPPMPKKLDIGVVAAIGVAVGGITAAIGALLQAFFGLGIWMPLGLVGLVLLISGPSLLVAWLKLRQRNLGPILDANGWALNANARINVPFGESLTRVATLPKGARVDMVDPYADQGAPWWIATVLVAAVALGWYFFFRT